jgi:hypothetical protein
VGAYRASTLRPKVGEELKSEGLEGDAPGRHRGRWWLGAGLAVVVIAIVAIVLAQGGGSDGGPLNAIAKAAEVTQREPGGRALIHAHVTSSTAPVGITESGSLTFDDSGKARGTVTTRGYAASEEVTVESIAEGTTTYMSSDEFKSIPEGKKWIELDLSSVAAAAGSSTSAASGPTEGLKILETVENAEEVGKEDIDGVPTTHYTGTLPVAKEVFGVKLHVSNPEADVWIDAQDRVRRLHMVVSGTLGESEESSTTDMTMDYVEFGRVPKIEIPPADEVFNATSKFESAIQTAGEGN